MPFPATQLELPLHLERRPVFAVPFFHHDPGREGDTDCQLPLPRLVAVERQEALRQGFPPRRARWSRQSEELPLARLVDLVTLLALVLDNRDGNSLVVPAGTFEGQEERIVLARQGGGGPEREFFGASVRASLENGAVLRRRLGVLADRLAALRGDGAI